LKDMTVRKALPGDIDGIAYISRNTWDGEDYLEGRAEEWIADGTLWVGVQAGTVVGTFRSFIIPPRVIWLEALRIRPDMRGMGHGRRLSEKAFQRGAALIGAGAADSMEFSTYVFNHESIHIARSWGFREVDRFMLLQREVPADARGELEPASVDLKDIEGEYLPCGWRFARVSEEGLRWVMDRSDCLCFQGTSFLRRRGGGGSTAPVMNGGFDIERYLRGAQISSAASGDSECTVILHRSRRSCISRALEYGFSPWEPVEDGNVLLFRWDPES